MSKTDQELRQEKLETSRLEMEARLEEVRGAVHEKLGWVPQTKTWLMPILIGAAGLVGGMAVNRLVGKRKALKGRRG